MGQTISTKHPAVVLRSRYNTLRGMLAVALVAVVALAAAVVVLAVDEGGSEASFVAPASLTVPGDASATRSDGGPEESAIAGALGRRAASPAAGGPSESVVADAVTPD